MTAPRGRSGPRTWPAWETPTPDDDWARALAVGSPPFHRHRHPAFRSARITKGVEAAQAWRELVAQAGPGLDHVALEVAGLDAESLDRAFGDAELVGDAAPPEWMRCLLTAVDRFPRESGRHAPSEDSIDVAADSFRDAAAALLDWELLVARHAFLDDRALTAFSRHLATRVVMSCAAVLELESMHAADSQWDFTRSAWRERLVGFPGLNYVMGTAVRQWRDNALELLDRLHRDLGEIRATLLADRPTGPVTKIDFDLGDRHHDGRSVSVVTFESGASVVYKPKDLRCARAFLDLAAMVNDISGDTLLRTFRILLRDRYAWEEYVHQDGVDGHAGAARFFERYGVLLRILQLVEGRDFWVDNLRVSQGFPVFVDLECILQPRIHGMGFEVSSPRLDVDLYDESVLPTAAVTQQMDVGEFGRQDFGGLAGGGRRALPLGLWSGYRDRDNGNIVLRDGRLFWAPDVAWPQVDGRSAMAEDFLADLDRGYRTTQSILTCSHTRLTAGDGPLHDVADLKVRALLRSTWEYLILLRVSLDPTALLSGAARETVLARVLATTPAWGDERRAHERLRVAWSEVASLRVLDVPEFLSSPSTTIVEDVEGPPLASIFSGTAQERLMDRLAGIDQFQTDSHAEVLGIGVHLIRAMTSTPQTTPNAEP
jgi:hypothetical protein